MNSASNFVSKLHIKYVLVQYSTYTTILFLLLNTVLTQYYASPVQVELGMVVKGEPRESLGEKMEVARPDLS